MKIIRLTTLLDFGGQEQKYISFTEKKNLLEYEYFFCAIGYGGHASRLIANRGFRVLVLDRDFQIYSLKNILNIWTIFCFLKKEKPDVVHTAAAEANFFGVIAARLAGVKVVIAEEIGIPAHSKLARLIFKWVYKLTDAVICVSEAVKKRLIEINEINLDKGVVLYNPVTEMTPIIHKEMTDKFEMVCVGRLETVKNQNILIKAIAELNRDDIHLTLVGDGRERKKLEELVDELGVREQVTFTGFSSEPAFYLSRSNLFVLPSLSEGFGIAAVEAMQMGIPCLCSDVGGIPEFIEHNETGWLFNPLSENDLVFQLNTILSMTDVAISEIGLRGQQHVKNLFSTAKYVNSLEGLYQKLYSEKERE